MKIGDMDLSAPTTAPARLTLLLWGGSGIGKTTLAATAPGHKLWLVFDHDATSAIASRKDFTPIDMSGWSPEEVDRDAFSDTNPLGLDKWLEAHPEVETVVLDSTTSAADIAITRAITEGYGRGRSFTPTLEAPGLAAYQARNAKVAKMIAGLLRVTARHKRHLIVISHEGDGEFDDAGNFLGASILLGGKMRERVPLQFSEVWWMNDNRNKTTISIRPVRGRKPMKTRMFDTSGDTREFISTYDINKPDSEQPSQTIAGWYNTWIEGGGKKIKVPTP